MKPLKQLCTCICGTILLSAVFMPTNLMAQATPAPVVPTPPAFATPPPVDATPSAVPATPPAVPAAAPAQAVPPAVAPQSAPAATMAPAAAPVNTAAWQALEPVRQAIARRDYAAAQQALEQAKHAIPNDPALAMYENLIRTGMTQSATGRNDSIVRTPMPGVTPLPVVTTPAPTPEPTPAPTPVPTFDEGSSSGSPGGGVMQQAQNLLKNDTIKYAVYGVGGLIVLLILWLLFRKKKQPEQDESEAETPVPGTLSAVGGFDNMNTDFNTGFDPNAGSTDFGMGNAETDFSAGGAAMGGAAADAAPDFTTFGLDDDEEEKPAKPTFKPRPAPVEDEGPLSLTDDDEPTAIISEPIAPTAPVEPQEPTAPSEPSGGVTFESLGLEPPAASEPTPAPANPTPTSSASVAPDGEVNLDDIFGNQNFPGSQNQPETPSADEERNSQTLPTFVSTPDSEDPEDSVEIPGKGQRQGSEDSGDQTISFDELFGGSSSASTPAVDPNAQAPAPQPTPAPETEAPAMSDETSIEDALAATLGAMESQDPGEAKSPASPASGAGESLDERTERMFNDQMEKARQAMDSKDWRQAVHVLSIASALHPEHEEAKQMLRDARAEKRKAEESV